MEETNKPVKITSNDVSYHKFKLHGGMVLCLIAIMVATYFGMLLFVVCVMPMALILLFNLVIFRNKVMEAHRRGITIEELLTEEYNEENDN